MSNLKRDFTKVTEVKLVYHNKVPFAERLSLTSAQDAYRVLYDTWDLDKLELQEEFRIILLDRVHNCLGISTLFAGGISGCVTDLRLVFATAIKARASSIVLSHNHPSGNKIFSAEDKRLTAKFAHAGRILDIPVVDHILVTKDGYSSMADMGIMP